VGVRLAIVSLVRSVLVLGDGARVGLGVSLGVGLGQQ
jgi:hypothetical protein